MKQRSTGYYLDEKSQSLFDSNQPEFHATRESVSYVEGNARVWQVLHQIERRITPTKAED